MPAALIHEITEDEIRCEWCGLPVAFHPQDANDTFRCFDARARPDGKFPSLEGFRWVTP